MSARKNSALAAKIEFFIKPLGLTYISGEESALLNLIEGKRPEPRLKPPYPTEHGLYGRPTLINNVETFYDVALVAAGTYEHHRFYTVSGAVKRRGVYSLPANLSIEDVLRRSHNYPERPFFVQIGGEASGQVLNSSQLSEPVDGAGSIMVYDLELSDPWKLVKRWLRFYRQQSCGQCTVCREGSYRLDEMVSGAPRQRSLDKDLFWELVSSLEESSFCALGYSLPVPLRTYAANVFDFTAVVKPKNS